MKTINTYLDDLKEKTGSDYKTAKLINVNKATISIIRKRGLMSDETAVKVADALEIDRAEVIIAAELARASEAMQPVWLELGKRLAVVGSMAAVTTATLTASIFGNLVCILCQIMLEARLMRFHLFNKWSRNNDGEKEKRTTGKIELLLC